MKKRLLIICSIIGVLLAGFQFPIYAEETTPDYSSSTSIVTSAALDQYFYDNYELLPYIEKSNKNQVIDTGISVSSNLKISASVGQFKDGQNWIFGASDANSNRFSSNVLFDDNRISFQFDVATEYFNYDYDYYSLYNLVLDRNKAYINNNLIHTFEDNDFESSYTISVLGFNNHGSNFNNGLFNLYHLSIYDYAANEGEGALVRDYYPARSKSGGIIGLYDAVNKTFVTTAFSVPFSSPTGDPVNLSLGANVTQFLSGSLSWIGAIFEGINEMPIIWIFIAIALAGVAFRWARRIVHF